MYVSSSLITVIIETCNNYAFSKCFIFLWFLRIWLGANTLAHWLHMYFSSLLLLIEILFPNNKYTSTKWFIFFCFLRILPETNTLVQQVNMICFVYIMDMITEDKPHMYFDRLHTFNNLTFPSILFSCAFSGSYHKQIFWHTGWNVCQLIAVYGDIC